MKEYLKLCKKVLKFGLRKTNRTGVDTISYFGYQMRFNLDLGFPLLTTKKVHFKSIVHELLWFLKGSTNIKYLVGNNVRIWNEWAFLNYKKTPNYNGEDILEFAKKIKEDEEFAKKYGELGPIYGKQWRDFNGFDQIKYIINEIKTNKESRRMIVSAWNPPELDKMVLPPCHVLMHFIVENDKLNLQLYQRSADIFLGLPFNIASYSLLLMIISKITNLKPGVFVHTIGDAHIYINHLNQIKKQLKRRPKKLPNITFTRDIKSIDDIKFDDFKLENYKPHPTIKGDVAV